MGTVSYIAVAGLGFSEKHKTTVFLIAGKWWRAHNPRGCLIEHLGAVSAPRKCIISARRLDPINPLNAVRFLSTRYRVVKGG